ncbi:MAG: sporulation protein YqfC [Mahellales bacterium]
MKVKRLDNIKASISDVLELPKDVMLNLPKINIVGNNQMYVENHRGIIEYTSQRIRINSTIGIIRILGNSMVIKNIEKNEIVITGYFLTMEFTQ